ncbi:retropepsin-like aspartic protease [Flagellimonas sp.]|uniref:retropepsin-like aspartic protease n=1 Tax=Flagellimonas sp. TaxID=2058762 RepID=UPI003BA9D02D
MNAKSDVISNHVDSISFTYKKKIIVVDASLEDNQEPHQFIFDTGAFYTKIEKHLADDLKLPTVFTKSNGTAQGITRKVEMTSANKIRLANTTYQNIAAGKLRYAKESYSPCLAEHGIIGANLIKLQNWKIDYQKQRLYFSNETFEGEEAGINSAINFSTGFLSGIPEIEINIDGKTIEDVLFDLGYNGGLVLPKKYAKLFDNTKSEIFLDKSTSGIFGSNLDTLEVKALEVTLGNSKSKIPVEFSSLNKALLGNDVLEHFTVYLNYNDEKITLVPVSPITLDEPKRFIPGILNDSLWVVDRIHDEIPLKIGDTLKSINGFRPKELFKSHCDYFLNASKFMDQDSITIGLLNDTLIKSSL